MEFTIKGTSKNEVTISKDTMRKLIDILDKVECTCIWSDVDNQYIKVQDVPSDLVDELIIKMRLAG